MSTAPLKRGLEERSMPIRQPVRQDNSDIADRVNEIHNNLSEAFEEVYQKIDILGFSGYNRKDEFLLGYYNSAGNLDVVHEIIDLKTYSPESYKHSLRVSLLSNAVADDLIERCILDITPKQKREFLIAALLHDYGKMGVPQEILHKDGKHTDDESSIMRSHTNCGDIIRDYVLKGDDVDSEIIVDIAEGHHPGYGSKLKNGFGEIVTIADHMDAAMLRGGYQSKLSAQEFLGYLNNQIGFGVFNEKYVAPFKKMLEEWSKSNVYHLAKER